VKGIVCYLLYTKDKGLILHPMKSFALNIYVGADFAGMWHQEHSALQENVLSCTDNMITHCGCPIHWVSKLQSEIALSMTKSEYIALSMATRELLPLCRLMQEINLHSLINAPLGDLFNTTRTPTLAATQIFEDNQACIVLATSTQQKIRTKHIAIKWHHFRDQICNRNIKELTHTATGQIFLQNLWVFKNWRQFANCSWAGDTLSLLSFFPFFVSSSLFILQGSPCPNPWFRFRFFDIRANTIASVFPRYLEMHQDFIPIKENHFSDFQHCVTSHKGVS